MDESIGDRDRKRPAGRGRGGCFPGPVRRRPGRRPIRPLLAVLSALLPIMVAAGCSEDSTRPETRDGITVFGYLYVGQRVDEGNSIWIGRTAPAFEHYEQASHAVRSARVVLEEEGSGRVDSLAEISPGRYGKGTMVIRERTLYRLRITTQEGETVEAETFTPWGYDLVTAPPEVPATMRYEEIQAAHPIQVTCPDDEQIFLVDTYCLEPWETARYIHQIGPDENPQDYDEYGGDHQEPRHIQAYFRLNNVKVEGAVRTIDFYGAMLVFYGQYDLNVLSIDDNYYSYLYRDHPEENGGIRGGLGVFGSACRESFRIEVVE